ncbi:flavin-dependent monooxygenase [Microbacterium sp. GXF7504]
MSSTAVHTGALRDRVRELLPAISERASRTEAERRIPAETIAELREIGFFRAYQPAAYGGLELSPAEVAESARLLASACMSTGWVASLLAAHNHAIASFSPQLQEEIWGENPDTLVSSSVAPIGRATEVEGGVRLSGRFQWSSGCEHATWAILGFQGKDLDGEPIQMFAVVPREDYEIEEHWNVMGLRGTGSHDIVVDDVFVPDYRIETVVALNLGLGQGFGTHANPIYKLPFMPVFSLGFSAVSLGAAEGLRDLYRERLSGRVRAYTGAKVAESSPAIMRLAESTHELRAAALLLQNDWRAMLDFVESNRPIGPMDITDWRGNQAFATRTIVRAADRLFEASGGGAVRDESPMQRFWRDLHTGASHAYSDYDVAAQTAGAAFAGVAAPEGTF